MNIILKMLMLKEPEKYLKEGKRMDKLNKSKLNMEEDQETVVKDLGNGIYEISCYPAFCFMFEVVNYLPVGEIASPKAELAYCTTQDLWFSLRVDFTCKIIEVNQDLIDYTEKNKGDSFLYSGFNQTDWICRVQKINN